MGEFFGDLERLAADLYPYRWPIMAGLLAVVAAVAAYGYRREWHQWAWERRLPVAVVGTPLLVVAVVGGYFLGSPLFTNVVVEEELPAAFAGAISPGSQKAEPVPAEAGSPRVPTPQDTGLSPTKTPAAPRPSAAPAPTATVAPAPLSLVAPRPVATSPEPSPSAGQEPTATPAPRPSTAGPVRLKVGEFTDQDAFHKGSGTATIFRGPDGSHLLRLEDFKVTNGPDLHVILTPHESPARRDDVASPGFADLGKLKGNEGNQNYPIPAEVDVAIQRSVVIYCQPFHVIFSVAVLREGG